MREVVVVDVVRTASGRGKPGGALSGTHPVDLLATVLRALVERTGIDPGSIDDVIGGCVQQIGEQGMNTTRSAVLAAGFPESVPAVTVDRQCGSSQQAVAFAAQAIASGFQDIVIACGVESMSRIPLGTSTRGADPSAKDCAPGIRRGSCIRESRRNSSPRGGASAAPSSMTTPHARTRSPRRPLRAVMPRGDHCRRDARGHAHGRRNRPPWDDGRRAGGAFALLPHRRVRTPVPRDRVGHHARQFLSTHGRRLRGAPDVPRESGCARADTACAVRLLRCHRR